MAYDVENNIIHVYKHDDPTTKIATSNPGSIMTLKTVEQMSYVGDELAYDTMLADLMQERSFQNGQAVYDTQLTDFPYGSPIELNNSGANIQRRFYVDTSHKISNHVYEYDNVSVIGVLDRQYFKGNVYQLTTFGTILAQIVGASGTIFSYDCSNVSDILVAGWLPYSTKREALKQLLFATNVHAFWDDSTATVIFDYIDHTSLKTIDDANIFDDGRLEYLQLATHINVTEHTFFAFTEGQALVTLFDNSAGNASENELVVFNNAPIIVSSLVTTGSLTFTDASTDSAVVTGRGKLQGYPYQHTTFKVERDAGVTNRQAYEADVSDAYLVSFLNSENVADRLADYYFNRYLLHATIKVDGESCGHYYTLKDAFKTVHTGFLQKMEKVYSSFIKAQCEFLCGVNESIESNTFSRYYILYYNPNKVDDVSDPRSVAQTGTWTVPSGVHKIRVALIGGGKGGDSGFPGEPGTTSGTGGKGGAAGASGHGGNIYVFTLDVEPGQVFDYSLGVGGAGGAQLSYSTYQTTKTNNPGSDGTDTTFGLNGGTKVYSSADGAPSDIGWYCLPINNQCGKPGWDMSEAVGGDGGSAGEASDVATDTLKRKGSDGTAAKFMNVTANGGVGADGIVVTAPTSFKEHNPDAQAFIDAVNYKYQVGIAGGGGGGGAIAGTAGAGGIPSNTSSYYYDQSHPLRDGDSGCWHEVNTNKGGNGGNGASAGSYSKSWFSRTNGYGFIDVLGSGGRGGFGGGGGGGAAASRTGTQTFMWLMMEFAPNSTAPAAGAGGSGGKGQDGSDGGIIIFI